MWNSGVFLLHLPDLLPLVNFNVFLVFSITNCANKKCERILQN